MFIFNESTSSNKLNIIKVHSICQLQIHRFETKINSRYLCTCKKRKRKKKRTRYSGVEEPVHDLCLARVRYPNLLHAPTSISLCVHGTLNRIALWQGGQFVFSTSRPVMSADKAPIIHSLA